MLRFLLLLMIASPALADEQLWAAGIAHGPIRGRLVTWLEVQQRVGSDPVRPTQLFLRPAIGVQIAPGTNLLVGYVLAETYPEGRATVREHRTWQQLLAQVAGTPGKAVLVSRTRLEQRFVEGQDDDAMRLRQFLRGQIWVGDKGWSLIGFTEGFIGFEATAWGQQAGFEQLRSFAGIGIPLSERLTLEAGYLNQRFIRPGDDGSNHVLNINLFYRLG
jgi:hypothetical protein